MTHYSRVFKVVVDAAPDVHDRELAFWKAASGAEFRSNTQLPEYEGAYLPGSDFGLLIQRLGQGESRVHIDIHADDIAAEVTRLQKLGAELVEELPHWSVLRDPAGLLFCVVEERSGELNDSNATRWD